MPDDVKKEIFEFLNVLSDVGAVNMFGAAPVIADEFSLSNSEARKTLAEWMEQFTEE